jgi:hypothetical protein
MIPIAAIKPLLKYFDAVDMHCTAGLMNKRPHTETTITQNFCSLMDQEEQKQAELIYSFKNLSKDLLNLGGGLRVEIRTDEYNSAVESRVTQSDLGLIINYINYYDQSLCWTESWLFQAKSLKPSDHNPLTYLAESQFDSISVAQIHRIKQLQNVVKADFVRFMEYCPRAYLLDKVVQDKFAHYRNVAFTNNIFDYALGLELYDCLAKVDRSLEPGIFISYIGEDNNKTYLDLYKKFWKESHPFSWFILLRLSLSQNHDYSTSHHEHNSLSNRISIKPSNLVPSLDIYNINHAVLAHAITRCDQEATNYVLREIGDKKGNFTIYPARTMTIDIRVGGD